MLFSVVAQEVTSKEYNDMSSSFPPKILNLINDQNVHNWWKFELGIDRNQNNSLINFLLHRQQHKNGKSNISHIRLTICHKYPKLTAMRRQHSFAELAGILANAIIGKQPESDTR